MSTLLCFQNQRAFKSMEIQSDFLLVFIDKENINILSPILKLSVTEESLVGGKVLLFWYPCLFLLMLHFCWGVSPWCSGWHCWP